jgi:hypothetical protein
MKIELEAVPVEKPGASVSLQHPPPDAWRLDQVESKKRKNVM